MPQLRAGVCLLWPPIGGIRINRIDILIHPYLVCLSNVYILYRKIHVKFNAIKNGKLILKNRCLSTNAALIRV